MARSGGGEEISLKLSPSFPPFFYQHGTLVPGSCGDVWIEFRCPHFPFLTKLRHQFIFGAGMYLLELFYCSSPQPPSFLPTKPLRNSLAWKRLTTMAELWETQFSSTDAILSPLFSLFSGYAEIDNPPPHYLVKESQAGCVESFLWLRANVSPFLQIGIFYKQLPPLSC